MGRVVAQGLDPDRTRVGDVMTRDLVVGQAGDSHEDGLRKMKQAGCRHLPVVEGDRLVGMVSQRDLLQIDLTREGRGDPLAQRLHPLHSARRRKARRSPGPGVRVVLVRPESPANVGAAARAVRNTGLHGLDLVEPGDWRTVECWRTAWGAHEVLERRASSTISRPRWPTRTYVAALSGQAERGSRPARRARDGGRGGRAARRSARGARLRTEASGLTHARWRSAAAVRSSRPIPPSRR